jgi:hypothetical protein
MSAFELTALSPLDGRYHEKTAPLRPLCSEFGLIRYRLQVELAWLRLLAQTPEIADLPPFSAAALARVRAWRRARKTLEREDLLGLLEVLAGARPAPPARAPSSATLARVLAACWQRRCRVLGD